MSRKKPHLNVHLRWILDQLEMYISWHKRYYVSTYPLIWILTHGFKNIFFQYTLKKYINLELNILKTVKILEFISVNNMVSYNVRTHWMYLNVINIGLKMVWWDWNM